jgi:hypothetical protein
MSAIFYSQVNPNLRAELNARGRAGSIDRTTAAMQFMLEKIANVELTAYESRPQKDSKPFDGYGILGGASVVSKAYMPSGPEGFLNDRIRPAHRIPPFITNVNTGFYDQSKFYMNKTTIDISIPDPTTDLNEIERIYCAPGRYIQLVIAHPETAVITNTKLSDLELPSTQTLTKLYPNVDLERLKNMNEFYFQGRISNFTFSYTPAGTVELQIEAIGTSNTYAEVQLYIKNSVKTKNSGSGGKDVENQVSDLYAGLSRQIDDIIQAYKETGKENIEFEQITSGTKDQGLLVGVPYKIGNTNSPHQHRLITLGYLINYINTFALERVGSRIVCNDSVCLSNFYEKIVSADPENILLWSGTNGIKTDVYNYDITTQPPLGEAVIFGTTADVPEVTPAGPPDSPLKMFPNVNPQSEGFSVIAGSAGVSYPSRIYINIDVIQNIINEMSAQEKPDLSIRHFLNKLSNIIYTSTGNAIRMVLVQDPIIPDALLYTDVNYVDSDRVVTEFEIPIFTSKTGQSVVRDFSLTSNVPNSIKNMIFGITSGATGTQKQVAYNGYIYGTEAQRIELEKEWRANHEQSLKDLATVKNTFSKRPDDPVLKKTFAKVLEQYISYFTPDIKKSIQRNKTVFPMELEFTIDGINGFKYGDVLTFAGLPRRYTDAFVFTIMAVTHEVSNTGDWTTKIRCVPRVRILE